MLIVWGCGEKTEVGDSPITVNARKSSEPEFAEKRAKHTTSRPDSVEDESSRTR